MNCHSCVRQLLEGPHSVRAPPLSLPLKTCPLFLYTKNYWHSLSQTLRASHNYRVRRLHLRIYANSFRSPSRTVWGDDGNRHLNAFKFLCVCVFLLILADVMKSISSLAAGHHSGINRGECGWEKYFFPCWSCVTLAVGHGGCCLSTTRVFFVLPLQWCVCAADSADCWVISCPVKSLLCSPLSVLHPLTPKHIWRMLQMNSFSLGVVWSKCYSGSTGSYIRVVLLLYWMSSQSWQ